MAADRKIQNLQSALRGFWGENADKRFLEVDAVPENI